MLQVQNFDPSHINESQLYEDLSQIIKSFKNLLSSLDSIASNLIKFESTSDLFEELRQTLSSLNGFIKIYSYTIDNDSQHKKQKFHQSSTFHRFVCRLIESISAYKVKLQNLPYFTTLSSEVRQIENIIMSYQQDKNIGVIIKKIQNVVNRFCSKTIKSLQANNKSPQKSQKLIHSEKNSEFTTITNEYPNSDNTKFSFTINEVKPKKVVESKSENSLNKVMSLLNRKYRTLACLDVEYNQFKQLFFRSRDSRAELYDDCFERNSFIYKEILRYSKQFSEYLEKRELKIFRKNKFIDSLGQNNIKVKSKAFPGKNQDSNQINFNFTKKKVVNTDLRKITEHVNQIFQENSSELNSPYIMARSQIVDQKFSNLVSLQHPKSGHMTPQLIEQKKRPNIFPLMINGNQYTEEREKFDQINGETFLELSKRKKNLQLKKIDISLTSFGNGPNNQIQSAKMRNKLMNGEAFKKVSVNNQKDAKQMEEKLNNSIRKNYLQKRYEQAMKKNMDSSIMEFEDDSNFQLPLPSKHSSSKFLQFQQQTPQNQVSQHRKYLIKTSNKRSINKGETQFKSLNHTNQKRQISTIKNFRTLKMDQHERIEKLEKMKENAINHIELISGGKAIRPAFQYRLKERTSSMYTEGNQEEFSDINLGSFKQFDSESKQQRFS